MSDNEQGAEDRDNWHWQEAQEANGFRPPPHAWCADLDEVKQILFAMRLTAASFRRALAENPGRVPELLDTIHQQTEAAVETIRRL